MLHIVGIFDKIRVLTVRLYTFPVLVCRHANGYSDITVKLAGALPSVLLYMYLILFIPYEGIPLYICGQE